MSHTSSDQVIWFIMCCMALIVIVYWWNQGELPHFVMWMLIGLKWTAAIFELNAETNSWVSALENGNLTGPLYVPFSFICMQQALNRTEPSCTTANPLCWNVNDRLIISQFSLLYSWSSTIHNNEVKPYLGFLIHLNVNCAKFPFHFPCFWEGLSAIFGTWPSFMRRTTKVHKHQKHKWQIWPIWPFWN